MTLTRCVIVFFLLIVTKVALAATTQDQIGLTRQGTELLLQRRYPEARKFIEQLLEKDETRLLGHFGIMAYTQLRNLENYDYRFDSEYLVLAEEGQKRALEVYRNPSSAGWDLLVAGGILGVTGFYKAHHGKWLPAFRDSQTSIRAMKLAYANDPHLADALLGIGFYHYWMSHFTRYFKVLPFLADRRDLGKREVYEAGERGQVVGPLAKVSLGFISYVEKDYSKTLEVTQKFLETYPDNTIVRMLQGQSYFKTRKYSEARREFQKILEVDSSLTKCLLYLGLIYAEERKEPEKARKLLTFYLNIEKKAPVHWRKRAEEALKRLGSTK